MSESYQVNFDLQLGETTRMSYLQQAHYPFTVQRGYILHMFPPHILQIHNHQNTINLTLLLLIFSKWYKKKYFVRPGIQNYLSHVIGLHVVKCISVMYANCPYPGCPCSTVKTGLYYGSFFFQRRQRSWLIKILLVPWDVILWVTGLLHYNARWFITFLDVRWDVCLWLRVTHEIHQHWSPTNNDDSTVFTESTLRW